MFPQVAPAVTAILVLIFLFSIGFAMFYAWFLRREKRIPKRIRVWSSPHKRTPFNSEEGYTIFHSLYQAMKEKDEEKKTG